MTQPAPVQGAPTEALAGLVERVTFHSAETDFCVLRVKVRGQRDLVPMAGHAASISAGEWVQMSGSWVNDRAHGPQFRAAFPKTPPPTTLEGIERCLGSGMIRGIGPVYATARVSFVLGARPYIHVATCCCLSRLLPEIPRRHLDPRA